MDSQLQFGNFRIDVGNQRLWCNGQLVELGPKAFAILAYLILRAGQLVTRAELLESIWSETHVDDHTLSVHIHEIRLALGEGAKQSNYIETRHRRGYVFRGLVEPVTAPPVSPQPIAQGAPETRYARSGDLNIAYQVIGDGPIDLIFIMGWVSHLEYFWREPSFARFLKRLSSFSRLILFDKRGTGLSDRVPVAALPTLEERMDDLRAVMEAVGSRKAAICGISEGGPLASVFAATYPEKTLALTIIGGYAKRIRDQDYPWGPTPDDHERFIEVLRREWGGPVGLEERAPSVANDPAFREWWATYLRMGASPGAVVALTRMNAAVDVRGILRAIRVPTLVLHRTGDRLFNVEEGRYLASHIPGAKFVELAGDDHLPFVGDQDELLNEIRGFLAGQSDDINADRVLATILIVTFIGLPENDVVRFRGRMATEIEWYRGHQFEFDRDKLIVTFDGPARAVRCASALSHHAADVGVAIRAGLHTGECLNPKGRVVSGPAVDVAEAIHDHAMPGEILVSSTIRDLVSGSGIDFAEHTSLQKAGSERDRQVLCVIG